MSTKESFGNNKGLLLKVKSSFKKVQLGRFKEMMGICIFGILPAFLKTVLR